MFVLSVTVAFTTNLEQVSSSCTSCTSCLRSALYKHQQTEALLQEVQQVEDVCFDLDLRMKDVLQHKTNRNKIL